MIPSWIGHFNNAELRFLNRVKPTLRQAPSSVKISYYNATFSTEYWEGQRVHAILLEFKDKTKDTLSYTKSKVRGRMIGSINDQYPISKQIAHGLDQENQAAKSYFTTVCGDDGVANIFFGGLKPGSRYKMYVTAATPDTFEPVIYADDDQVTLTEFYTLWNPNLRNK